MIQRIQTIYLALVAILSFVALITRIGYYTIEHEVVVAAFNNFTFNSFEQFQSYESAGPFCLGILLIMVIFISVLSIMLFRKRMRQLRLTIMSTMLLLGYCLSYAAFAYFYQGNLECLIPSADITFHFNYTATFPVICIILNMMAIHGIRKDEALVRSLDRLR